ncbi:GNAT family N-acetyltransferase [Saccharopolyspora sp. NPDC047091]|uniref:GNAT family N-acetyltransferase n=1 Tax=Saccharopolyspora sp. NPDC047091 TaxID=3155924 RepID=UPI0033C7662D
MSDLAAWPAAAPLLTVRLRLEPLRVEHARETAPVLDDVRLHEWTGGAPRSPDELAARYRWQVAGRSPDGEQGWLNWILRDRGDGRVRGTVQATLTRPEPELLRAALAWVVGTEHQGHGYAREAALAMTGWLHEQGVGELTAHIHPGHRRSSAVARAVGLSPTSAIVDGEIVWSDRDR